MRAWAFLCLWLPLPALPAGVDGSHRLTLASNLWQSAEGRAPVRTLSLVGTRPHGQLGETLCAVGDLDGDGRADWVAGGGRAGLEPSAGRAVVFGIGDGDPPLRQHSFEGRAGSPGYARVLASYQRPDRVALLAIARPVRGSSSPTLDLWQSAPGSPWARVAGPARNVLAGLNDVLIPGDVTGDGREDLVVAFAADGRTGVRVFAGQDTGFASHPAFERSWPAESWAGNPRVHRAGEVDGDGREDLLLAFPGQDTAREGRVALIPAAALGAAGEPLEFWRGAPGERFGQAILRVEVDGDGRWDLLVGAPGGPGSRGRLLAYRGRPGGWESQPFLAVHGDQTGENFGHSLATGYLGGRDRGAFLVIGAPGSAWQFRRSGMAYILPVRALRAGDISTLPAVGLWGGRPEAELGRLALVPGDVDGDGCDDLLLGLSRVGHRGDKAGRVEVLLGTPEWPDRGKWHLTYPQDPELLRQYPAIAPAIVSPPPAPPLPPGARPPAEPAPPPPPAPAAPPAPVLRPAALALAGSLLAAGLGGLAWWGRRRLERRVRDDERRRLVRDLHDELGGRLDALAGPSHPGRSDVATVAREVTTWIETTIRALHPDRQTLLDLASGLTDLSDHLLGDLPLRRRFVFPSPLPEQRFKPGVLQAVFRAAQEAMNNVRKHSRAGQVTLTLSRQGPGWELCIRDDGVGLPADDPTRARTGQGLENIRERLREIGGDGEVVRGPERGTEVRLRWPDGRAAASR